MSDKPNGAPAADLAADPNNPDPNATPNPNATPDGAAGGDGGTPAPTGEPSSTPDANANVVDLLQKILKEQGGGHANPDPKQLTAEQVREQVKEKTGWTDAQIDYHFQSVVDANAPLAEKIAWMELEKNFPNDVKIHRPAMEEELKQYPAWKRGDATLLQKVLYMVKGKTMSAQPNPNPAPTPNPGTRPPAAPPRRIVPGYQPSSGTDSAGGGSGAQLSNEEKQLARNMRIPEDRWAACKENKPIRELRSK